MEKNIVMTTTSQWERKRKMFPMSGKNKKKYSKIGAKTFFHCNKIPKRRFSGKRHSRLNEPPIKVSGKMLDTQAYFEYKNSHLWWAIHHSIDLAPKVPSLDVICVLHCLASLKILAGRWCHRCTLLLFTFSRNAQPNIYLLCLKFLENRCCLT